MTEPWNFTEAQRRQFREARAAAKLSRRPSKPWRVTASGVTTDYTSEKKAYGYINDLAAAGTASLGVKITVEHWEDGRWVLYERAVITENGWEPA